jgi:ATP-binding cassette subfamily C protein
MKARPDNVIKAALQQCRKHFWYAALFSGLINLIYLAPSIYMLQVYDRVVPTQGVPTLLLLTLALAICLIVFALLDLVRMRLLQRASARLERVAGPPLLSLALGSNGTSNLARSQAMRDFDVLRGTLVGPAIIAMFDAPWAPIYIIVSWMLHPYFGLFALFCAVLLVAISIMGERATRDQIRDTTQLSTAVARRQDFAIQVSEVGRALGMRRAMVSEQIANRTGLVTLQGDVARTSGNYLAVTKFLRMLFQSLALGMGAWLAVDGKISAGAIFAASLILSRALQPVEMILGAMKSVSTAHNAYKALVGFVDETQTHMERPVLPKPAGRVAVSNLCYDAPGSDRPILRDVSFSIEPGEIVALVGPSGAGKSTLQRLIAGGLAPTSGEIRIDGAQHADWNGDLLGRYVGYMPQEPTLFPMSVYDNISRLRAWTDGRGEELDSKVIEAAQAAAAHDLVLRLPEGYATDLGGRDGVLSAGQRQMVALARALFDWPSLVLLDEPNAHLDNAAEATLLQTLAALKRRKAAVIISSHRSGILQIVDKILVLREGAVQAFGPRDQILRPAPRPPQEEQLPAAVPANTSEKMAS